jgi:acyl carrier protein
MTSEIDGSQTQRQPGRTPELVRDPQDLVFEALETFGAEREKIFLGARLEDLEVDSLDIVELGQIVQDEYGVRLELELFKGVETVGDALDVIRRQLD